MPTLDSSDPCSNEFADQHIHGLAGVDFATSPTSDIRAALELLRTRRTTQVTASIPTVQQPDIAAILDRLRPIFNDELLAGVHFEGPFIAEDFVGAHPRQAVLSPAEPNGQAFLATVLEHQAATPMVTMMTVAPELDGFVDLVDTLVTHGITPALGHTAATYEQMQTGIEVIHQLTGQPVTITHLYNAMRGFHHRKPGPLLAVFEAAQQKRVSIELIADGHHVHPELITWWLNNFPAAIRLVSDASAATLPVGSQPLTTHSPTLGTVPLRYPDSGGPMLANGRTIASGASDLLAVHDELVNSGLDHDLVCAAMRIR
ncbi:MAG: hypothetical protein L0H44_03410 [Yaniella sp.]|uniref:hypothetical protein n=1 Tax=Yaniella sp. TaxID=2773929 RepID=UPI002648A3EA|nr:hypothetical protein [Yaniella sp.]MDN5817339.1 hypothetical protein [Yaniella sp.]MDN5837740.1 hypothetical protein [Yaniella sp.]